MFLYNAVRVKYLVTIQASFLLRRRRTLLANAIPWRSGVTARTGASPVPTLRRLGRPARRRVGVPLAGTLARFPLSFASKVRRRGEGQGTAETPTPPLGVLGPPRTPPASGNL